VRKELWRLDEGGVLEVMWLLREVVDGRLLMGRSYRKLGLVVVVEGRRELEGEVEVKGVGG